MITLKKIPAPRIEEDIIPIMLTDETIIERKSRLLTKMEQYKYDTLIIYADLEHGNNFEYLVGFLPRFEEALLVLHADGEAYAVLGNENLNKADKMRIKVTPVHMPHLSLPNQPMKTEETVDEILAKCHFEGKNRIGIIGWKNFTNTVENSEQLYDLPHFLMDSLRKVAKDSKFFNATNLMIGVSGIRTINNANEFAHYEFGAALAGNCILSAMDELGIGKTEMAIAEKLSAKGQRHSVVTIMAAGQRFINGNMYPSNKKISMGDTISMTTGYKGGLESRSGFAVNRATDLPNGQQDYLEKLAIPYFNAFKTWLETIKIGIKGGLLYDAIEDVFPKEKYNWNLNPGHLCGDEEWMSSPIYPLSQEIISSGMLFQIDIIPSIPGYHGTGCEGSIFLADTELRKQIETQYPEIWKRVLKRREYIQNVLGIQLSEEILPMSTATGYYRPFMLNQSLALTNN